MRFIVDIPVAKLNRVARDWGLTQNGKLYSPQETLEVILANVDCDEHQALLNLHAKVKRAQKKVKKTARKFRSVTSFRPDQFSDSGRGAVEFLKAVAHPSCWEDGTFYAVPDPEVDRVWLVLNNKAQRAFIVYLPTDFRPPGDFEEMEDFEAAWKRGCILANGSIHERWVDC